VTEASKTSIVLLPDAGPLITLAYADALDLLLKPGWQVKMVDMVLHEVTRNATPTSEKIRCWVAERSIPVLSTRSHQRHLALSQAAKRPYARRISASWRFRKP
jgi:hypothetical protein